MDGPLRPHNMQRETSLSATVAGTADFLNNYSYNDDSQVTQITQQGQTGGNTVAAKLVNLSFDNDGRLTVMSRYANLAATQLVATSTYGYNADSALTSLSHDKGATNLNSYTWSYDHDGRVTGDSSVDGTDAYTYDAASQLTAATHSYQTNESYSFDSTGNRTNTGYSTGTNNQLSSDGTCNYLYDAIGNMTKKTTISSGAYVTYTWDYRNRLTDVKAYNSSNVLQSHEHYIYDVFNRLIERQVDPTGGGTYTTTLAFIYKGSNVILDFNGSGTLTDRILNGSGANNALADENGSGTISWLLGDNQGTIRDVVQYNSGTDTTTIVDHLKYNSFGVITAQSNSAYQPLFTYTGQMWDAAAGLYYYHARWYDASTGRFISQDPIGFAAGDQNLYRYTANDPAGATDPNGLQMLVPPGMGESPPIIIMDRDEFEARLQLMLERMRLPPRLPRKPDPLGRGFQPPRPPSFMGTNIVDSVLGPWDESKFGPVPDILKKKPQGPVILIPEFPPEPMPGPDDLNPDLLKAVQEMMRRRNRPTGPIRLRGGVSGGWPPDYAGSVNFEGRWGPPTIPITPRPAAAITSMTSMASCNSPAD